MKHFQAYAAFGMSLASLIALLILLAYTGYRIGELIR